MKNFYIITFFMLGNTCFKKCTVVNILKGLRANSATLSARYWAVFSKNVGRTLVRFCR
jgi:hypothetical protein